MRRLPALCALVLIACDPSSSVPDAPRSDDGGRFDGGELADAPFDTSGADAAGSDAGGSDAGSADASTRCEPTPGPSSGGAYCDQLEIALLTSDDGPPRAVVRGRFNPDDLEEGGCYHVDEVEVQRGGVTVATLPGASGGARGGGTELLADGPAFAALTERCEGDDRFGGFGLLVRGRQDGGTFVGECADAEGGGRWPPALVVTCHHNVEVSPPGSYAISQFGFTTADVAVPHGAGAAITSVDGTVHVIPAFPSAFGGPPPMMIMPFDSAGWVASISESSGLEGPQSQLHLISGPGFPMELCPDGSTPPSPVFLLGITGSSGRGSYATEAYVSLCSRL